MQPGSVHESLKPISFLMGKWKSLTGEGVYPTLTPFQYCEEVEFSSVGQPMLNYTSTSWHPIKKAPMHLESGFMRIKPGTNELAFMVSHNFGLTSLEEGSVQGNVISLKSSHISRMHFAKDPPVTEIQRNFQYVAETQQLQLVVKMATTKTPLTEHLKIIYQKL